RTRGTGRMRSAHVTAFCWWQANGRGNREGDRHPMMSRRVFHWPVGAAAFAGLLGAGVVDAAVTLARAGGGSGVIALALGLYGTPGRLVALARGWAAAIVLDAIPGGVAGLRSDEALDARIATGVAAGAPGAAAAALGVAIAHGAFVAHMASHRL